MPAPSQGIRRGTQSLAAIGVFKEGREAAPLRKALVVIVVVAIAFVGGMVANGSRPGWVQAVLNLLPRGGPGLDTVVPPDLAITQDGEPTSTSSGPIPSAPVPPLVVGPVPEEATQSSSVPPSMGSPPTSLPASTASSAIPIQPSSSSVLAPVPESSGAPDSE